ncbi:hypothetical protein LIA77_07142 [Sarocladium implicatum]|nr:hypothetical protein LIA77_07142 [Sarocladium implicatum]
MKFFQQPLLVGLLWASLTSASPLVERDAEDVAANPCRATALKVNVQEIRGAHTHERVDVGSYRQCCEACYKKKGCALFTFVGQDDNYCRLTYRWEPESGTLTNKCTAKITTGYEDTDGANGIWYNMGAGPCGEAENCNGACVA